MSRTHQTDQATDESPNVYLFIVTTNHVLCYQASGKGSGGTPAVVDEIGAGLGCATIDWKAHEIVVARDEKAKRLSEKTALIGACIMC